MRPQIVVKEPDGSITKVDLWRSSCGCLMLPREREVVTILDGRMVYVQAVEWDLPREEVNVIGELIP